MLKNVIFDLDGTLIDSAPSIIECLKVILRNYNIAPVVPLNSKIIGPPLKETLKKITGIESELLLSEIIESFKSEYDSSGYRRSIPFNGVSEMLPSFGNAGINMHIATNKRIFPTNKILNYFSWTPFFKTINALDSTEIKFSSKAEMLGAIVANENLNLEGTIYVGDIFADYLAAQQNKINFIYAKWGYGENEAFDYPVAATNVDELIAKILN